MLPNPEIEKDLLNRFSYHKPDETAVEAHAAVRDAALTFAYEIVALCPASSERDAAVKKIELAMFLGNAAIARIDKDGARR